MFFCQIFRSGLNSPYKLNEEDGKMYKNVRGIRFREHSETLGEDLLEKVFEIEYFDDTHFNKTIFLDFMNVMVQDYGRVSMFIVKDVEELSYRANRRFYGKIVREVHDRLVPYLQKEYNYVLEMCLINPDYAVYSK